MNFLFIIIQLLYIISNVNHIVLCDSKYKPLISRTLLAGNKIADHSNVFGASPVGAASTISSFST